MCCMDKNKQLIGAEIEPERDCGKPLLIDWTDSEWFQIWLKLARHEDPQAV